MPPSQPRITSLSANINAERLEVGFNLFVEIIHHYVASSDAILEHQNVNLRSVQEPRKRYCEPLGVLKRFLAAKTMLAQSSNVTFLQVEMSPFVVLKRKLQHERYGAGGAPTTNEPTRVPKPNPVCGKRNEVFAQPADWLALKD